MDLCHHVVPTSCTVSENEVYNQSLVPLNLRLGDLDIDTERYRYRYGYRLSRDRNSRKIHKYFQLS